MLANTEMQVRVLQALEWEPSLDAALIGVAARDGVVTLAGTVRSWADRLTAERVVRRLSGVRAVSNELEVRLTVDSRRSDAELVHAALQALGVVGIVREEAVEDQLGLDLGRQRCGRVAPGERVLIDARVAAVAVA